MIVADTNLISYLLIDSPHSKVAEQVLQKDPDWIAPFLWRSEFRNILALYMRQQILTLEESLGIMDAAIDLMTGQEHEVIFYRVLQLAGESGCTAYDCEFIAVAEKMEVPLVTSDKNLLNAFPGITVSPQNYGAQ